jgi:hypothetical protein
MYSGRIYSAGLQAINLTRYQLSTPYKKRPAKSNSWPSKFDICVVVSTGGLANCAFPSVQRAMKS